MMSQHVVSLGAVCWHFPQPVNVGQAHPPHSSPEEQHSSQSWARNLPRLRIVGAKNMASSSGCAVTTRARTSSARAGPAAHRVRCPQPAPRRRSQRQPSHRSASSAARTEPSGASAIATETGRDQVVPGGNKDERQKGSPPRKGFSLSKALFFG